ncbi:type VI secretion system baseplate subunit TssE [Shewanella sp. VB17]|nr:type VI secretion system baseplate subunit TssE [Shewanella sp. VB17]
MFGVSFFQRLGADIDQPINGVESIEYVIASIKRNISGLLNTRVGESQSCPELGLFDFNDANSGSFDLGVRIKAGIKACIERFEPRLSHIDINVLHDNTCPFSLRFHIHGNINVKSVNEKVEIDLFLDSNRTYRVS